MQKESRVPDHRHRVRDISQDHRPHSHNGSLADAKRAAAAALTDHGTCPDICAVTDMDIAVALYSWCKSYKIADDAIMLDIAVYVSVKVLANYNVAGQHHIR